MEALCAETGIRAEQIDLIGSHGQTFWHIPLPETYLDTAFAAHSSWEKALYWRSGLAARW